MKCRRCRGPAVIEVRRHNAGFCGDCFLHHCHEQVRRTIDDFSMTGAGERVLVAVSGGKDSLALWDILLDLGHDVDGLYLGLGIGEYSDQSGDYARAFAARRGAKLVEVDLPADYGFDIPAGSAAAHRVPCSACGLSKRHLFNRAALDGGYDVVATGHNLDDEAAVLIRPDGEAPFLHGLLAGQRDQMHLHPSLHLGTAAALRQRDQVLATLGVEQQRPLALPELPHVRARSRSLQNAHTSAVVGAPHDTHARSPSCSTAACGVKSAEARSRKPK